MERDGRRLDVIRRARARASSIATAVAVVAALVTPTLIVAAPAGAVNVSSASFNVTAARNGAALVLTVATSNDVSCVQVSGAHTGQQTGSGTVWTFNFTAGTGNGTRTVTVTAWKNTQCNGQNDATTASYVLDNVAPTISGSRSPAANANGWNNTDVGVNFTCNDAGSGLASCGPNVTQTTQAANQSATGTAVDQAGNSASTTVSNISIDKTAPTLTGAPTTSPNGNGWYNANVTINWTCSDALSGIPSSTCPSNSTITGEGTNLTSSASVSDRANNNTNATSSPPVKIDRTAPVTAASALPTWNNTNVTVTLSATDALSGVAATHWTLDGGTTQNGVSVPVSAEGDHTLTYWSVDNADNVEATHTVHVRIDKTPPTIGHTQSPPANANGWNNTNVTVTFTCGDALSGVASCTAPQTVTTEGANQAVTGTATDNAVNTATDPAHVSIDKTKPTITAARDRAANANGWYKADVTVTYTCADALSGVATCTAPQTFGEGAAQTASGTVTDAAGNSASVSDSPINVDETAPTITGAPTTAPNSDGWYNANVTIHWTCSDPLSGLATACPPDTVLTGGGASVTATASVTDKAGNTTLGTSAPVKIDRLPPSTTSDAPSTWQNSNVTLHFSAVDDLSGVKTTYFTVNGGPTLQGSGVVISAEGTSVVQFWSEDHAGNVELPHTVAVMIDKTKPTITGTRTPAANANGWNNTDVGVNFACSDEVGGSGIASCDGSTTLTNESANQSVDGTATDVAGNSKSTTVSGISIDKTAPSLAGGPTTSPNGNDWYNDDVAIHWTCGDALSGIDGSCPADDTITGEGSGLTTSAAVSDQAGNTTNATSNPAVNIDRTAPVTSATAPPAWNSTDVTVALSASDALSGVAATHWSLDGGATQTGASVPVSTEGDHTLAFWSVDKADNVETTQSIHVKIDKTSPTIGHTQAPDANANGWNKTDVTVTFACTDALSGIASCTAPQTVTTEGQNQTVTGTATDNAGNSNTDPASVSIDKTKPTISASRDRSQNGNGWYNADVTVSFDCADALSGVESCSPQKTFGEGASQSATGTAVDAAGNSDSVTESPINVDETAPTITGVPTTAPNANGWYDGDVTIHWTCTDTLSGIDSCPPDSVITGSGTGLTLSGAATDAAGNSAVATSEPVNIDRVAPVTTSDAPLGWQHADVDVHFSATDDLSGVEHTFFSLNHGPATSGNSVTVETEGMTLIEYWSVDAAGNVEDANSATVLLDKSDPTIAHTQTPGPNSHGWNNTPVDVKFICSDAVSGVASCTDPSTVSTDGAGQVVDGTAVDMAGNTANDSATLNIDQVKPTISGSRDRDANGNGWYNADVSVSFACADALSGLASCSTPTTLGEGADQSVTGTAVDNADNSDSTTVDHVNIDETAPLLSGAPTTSSNGAGWYNHDVDIEWTCSDALSGIDGNCPPNSTVDGEGNNLSASATTYDKAGNSAHAAVTDLKIDRTAPATSASAPAGWVNHSVVVTLAATDNLSGVDTTHFILDGAPDTGDAVQITTQGDHTLEYWSVDVAGNAETHHVAHVLVDLSAPTISHSQNPEANAHGWNNTDVTVTFTCDDQPELSGLASCTAPQAVTNEGQGQTVEGTATDNAGNDAHDTAHVSIDKTKPTIAGARDRDPNAHGWYNADVEVTFTCDDLLSGVASCSSPVTLSEGQDQSATGNVEDAAGNSNSATVHHIDVDETDPTLSGAPTTDPNANGWYQGDVTIHWTCSDALSGIDGSCPADTVLTSEGGNLGASETVFDNAGNHATASVAGINIDRTDPTTTSDAPSAWQNSDVTVTLTPFDGLSGIDTTRYVLDGGAPKDGTSVSVTGEGEHSLEFWSVDNAGNVETHHKVTVRIDKTDPGITHDQAPAANGDGWNNTPVTVSFHCSDALSGIASCSGPSTLNSDGAGQTVLGSAADNAGNTASDTATVNIDQVPPAISSDRDRAANSNGWYDDDVTVSFSCTDALSGIKSCPAPVTVHEGAQQLVTRTALDLADNSASATESDINVDKTAPAINGTATSAPNADGWYDGDVTIHWSCSDALSGLDGACPADTVLTAEGGNLSASASVSDLAGNTSTATVSGIKIDRTAPTTTASAPSDWVNNDVTVTLTPNDALSGVAATYSSLDSGPAQPGTSVAISAEGVHSLEFWSVDHAGNVEPHNTISVRIDKSNPTITHTQAPLANGAGWNNSAVTVTFNCDDQVGLSGVASCTAPTTVSTQGAGQLVQGVAKDHAGNTATDSATLNIDTTPPTITGAADRAANAHVWYNDDVTVTFTCGDALSGVVTCAGPATLHEGADQSASGSVTDGAGNTASATVAHINVDKTAPTITGAPTTSPNGAGWYKGDVTIHWTCADALSGLDGPCPADTVLTGEGASLSASASIGDLADNVASATVIGIKIDRTAPTTTSNVPAGWQATDVAVHFTTSDNLSGVAKTYSKVDNGSTVAGADIAVTTEGTHTVEYWSVDAAGNAESHHTATVQIDKTKPTISGAPTTAPNGAGWYRTPVTVHFSCSDALSGIASCTADQTISTSGANQSVTGTAVDNAGNSKTVAVTGLHVDLVAPNVSISGVTDGASYPLGSVPTPSCTTADSLSGSAGCTGTLSGGTSNGVGTYTYTAKGRDNAGNETMKSATFSVAYVFSGFLQPINDTAHQTGAATSVFKAGSTVPVKFELRRANGSVAVPNALPQWLTPVRGASLNAAVDESLYSAPSTAGDQYRVGDASGQYIYNWSTKGLAAGFYYRIGVRLDDGTTYAVNIGLK
jgi:hypothetical protein